MCGQQRRRRGFLPFDPGDPVEAQGAHGTRGPPMSAGPVNRPDTRDPVYTARLRAEGGVWWKRLLRVQAPYGWNLRRLEPGFTLDIGCGIGRNLAHLRGHGIGIDHNADSVAAARARGFEAFTPEEFRGSSYDRPGRFDSLLLSHVAE